MASNDLLRRYGWTPEVQAMADAIAPEDSVLGRLIRVERGMDAVVTDDEELRPSRSHPLFRQAELELLPATGDWVIIGLDDHGPAIVDVVPRRTVITRRDPRERDLEQVVVANADTAMIVHGLDRPLNTRRLERTLVVILDGGANPVLVLTKSDLVGSVDPVIETIRAVSEDLPIHVVSSIDGSGFDELEHYRVEGETIALIGESGAGKSTLVNRWCDADQEVGQVRTGDAKGRHTTVSRDLLVMPGGGNIVDTPGVRGLGLWNAEDGLEMAFPDIERLAVDCRFADCEHREEPDCAVVAAIDSGALDEARHRSYLDLGEELARLRERQVVKEREAGRGRGKRRRRR